MIIICKECSTKFRLDESLLKETGSKVRCCVCKYIFTAYPPQTLGRADVSQPLPSQQGYFNSEEDLGPGGVGGFQKTRKEDEDEDGLELDVGEDEDMDIDGLDLGDDDS
ncbi:MAG: zinc-ribbon domain-containing protein, partial [Desulfobacteraceae bacterium]|nr:zinc-ribbon domain-containing protein [Desulfobacteraceae bacterium]